MITNSSKSVCAMYFTVFLKFFKVLNYQNKNYRVKQKGAFFEKIFFILILTLISDFCRKIHTTFNILYLNFAIKYENFSVKNWKTNNWFFASSCNYFKKISLNKPCSMKTIKKRNHDFQAKDKFGRLIVFSSGRQIWPINEFNAYIRVFNVKV